MASSSTETAVPEPDCLFCAIIAGTTPSEVVADNAMAIAIRDINPVAPTHVLVIPRRHIRSLHELDTDDADILSGCVALAQQVAEQEGVADGYGMATNIGADGGQAVFHLHFHVVGGSLVHHLSTGSGGL